MMISSLSVKTIYLLTYINYILFVGYFIFYISGKVPPPLGVEQGDMFTIIGACFLMPMLGHFALYSRCRFDLVRMRDGTSAPSRFLWTLMALGQNLILLHLFLRDIVRVY